MEVVTHKRCTKCGVVKSMDSFRVHKSAPDGRKTQCRDCMNEADRAQHAKKQAGKSVVKLVPLWPLPTYTIQDSLACVKLRKWRGPVNHEPMRARL